MDTSNQRKKAVVTGQPRALDWPLPNSWRELATTYFLGYKTKKSSKRWPRSLTKTMPAHAAYATADLSSKTAVMQYAEAVHQWSAHLDVLVNNADLPAWDVTTEETEGGKTHRNQSLQRLSPQQGLIATNQAEANRPISSTFVPLPVWKAYPGGAATASQNLHMAPGLQQGPSLQSWCKKALKYLPFCRERPGQTAGGV